MLFIDSNALREENIKLLAQCKKLEKELKLKTRRIYTLKKQKNALLQKCIALQEQVKSDNQELSREST